MRFFWPLFCLDVYRGDGSRVDACGVWTKGCSEERLMFPQMLRKPLAEVEGGEFILEHLELLQWERDGETCF